MPGAGALSLLSKGSDGTETKVGVVPIRLVQAVESAPESWAHLLRVVIPGVKPPPVTPCTKLSFIPTVARKS